MEGNRRGCGYYKRPIRHLCGQIKGRILRDEDEQQTIIFLRALELIITTSRIFKHLARQRVPSEKTRLEKSHVMQQIQGRYHEKAILASDVQDFNNQKFEMYNENNFEFRIEIPRNSEDSRKTST